MKRLLALGFIPALASCSALDHASGMSVETWERADHTGHGVYFEPKTIGTSGGGLFTGGVIDRATYSNAIRLGGGLQDSGRFNTPVPAANFFAAGSAPDGTHVYAPGWVDQGFADHHITFDVQGGYVVGSGFQFNQGGY